ncbi:MAG: hypothetical protein K9L73_00510 [Spirochaetia bacterium]|nr:hypothetical protein [Spirochaetia bacterium]
MYKSKKQNYPGLYGTFKKIDSSNNDEAAHTHHKHDFSTDDNLESLDSLIKNIKRKSQEYAAEIISDTKRHDTADIDETFVLEEELQELKKNHSFFNTHGRQVSDGAIFSGQDTDEGTFSNLVTDELFMEELEQDLLNERAPGQSATVESLIKELKKIQRMVALLNDQQREEVQKSSIFQTLFHELSGKEGQ